MSQVYYYHNLHYVLTECNFYNVIVGMAVPTPQGTFPIDTYRRRISHRTKRRVGRVMRNRPEKRGEILRMGTLERVGDVWHFSGWALDGSRTRCAGFDTRSGELRIVGYTLAEIEAISE